LVVSIAVYAAALTLRDGLNRTLDLADLATAISSLIRQLNVGEVPEEESVTVRSMVVNGQRMLAQLGSSHPIEWYGQDAQGGGSGEVE